MEDKNNINNLSKDEVIPYTYSDMNEEKEISELKSFSFKKLFHKDIKFFSVVLLLLSIIIFFDIKIIYINS